MSVTEVVLEEIHAAQRLADALNSPHPVRVKVDQNDLGHGVISMLQRWAETGRHRARRSSASWCRSPRARTTPEPSCGRGASATKCGRRSEAFSSPTRPGVAGGYVSMFDKKAATKKAMRARGMKSPDRAEAVLLALYEPEPLYKPRRRGLLN
ncbi:MULTISPECIES: hypothetical protein [unclassified Streptomyces]|uniref:hypothetical protein n=1 Tax=unclassified Streptomyces TaxID=2593676 RepID=UPI00341D115E